MINGAIGLLPAFSPLPATFHGLADLPGGFVSSAAFGISADGRVASAAPPDRRPTGPGRRRGQSGPSPGGNFGAGIDAADDGTVLVGSRQRAPGQFSAFRYTAAGGSSSSATCRAVSRTASAPRLLRRRRDRRAEPERERLEAYRWMPRPVWCLGDLPGGAFSGNAISISGDGTIVIAMATRSTGSRLAGPPRPDRSAWATPGNGRDSPEDLPQQPVHRRLRSTEAGLGVPLDRRSGMQPLGELRVSHLLG
jgi:uncharacterized membrane protein